MMESARILTDGDSQAVRLPESCRFDCREVLVHRIGNVVMLMPKDDPWSPMLRGLTMCTDDFLKEDIEDLPVQEPDQG